VLIAEIPDDKMWESFRPNEPPQVQEPWRFFYAKMAGAGKSINGHCLHGGHCEGFFFWVQVKLNSPFIFKFESQRKQ